MKVTHARTLRKAAVATGLVAALSVTTAVPVSASSAPSELGGDPATASGEGDAVAVEDEAATVTGPLESSDASHPFGGAAYQEVPQDLSELGYVEEEYLASGESNVYSWPEDAPRSS